MIKADGLTRYYGAVVAASDVSFEVGSGEIAGLLDQGCQVHETADGVFVIGSVKSLSVSICAEDISGGEGGKTAVIPWRNLKLNALQ